MDNLHFIPNNILAKFFKEITKYKKDYQQYLNYIYKLYYASYCIFLSVFMYMHEITIQYIYIYIVKTQRKSNWIFSKV